MKLTAEQREKLKNVVGKRASAKELLRDICNEKQRQVLDLSEQGDNPLEISEKLHIPLKEAEEILDFLYGLDLKIRELRNSYNKEKVKKGAQRAAKQNKRLNTTQKETIKKELIHFKSLYKQKKISKSDLKKNLNKLNAKINALGNTFEDRMFLAEVYAELEMIGQAEEVLYEESDKKTDVYKEMLYNEIEKEVIEKRNYLFIKRLREQGKTKEEIISIAEKQSTHYKKYLKLSFISYAIKSCDEEKRKLENVNNEENER